MRLHSTKPVAESLEQTTRSYPDLPHSVTEKSLCCDRLRKTRDRGNRTFQESALLIGSLKTHAKSKDLHRGASVHADAIRSGLLEKNPYVASSVVSMYAKCGALVKAEEVLDGLPVRDVIVWSSLIAGYAQLEHGEEALQCFERMQCEGLLPDAATFTCILKACGSIRAIGKGEAVHSEIIRQGLLAGNVVLGGALVDMYAKCGALEKAREVLESLPVRDAVTWATLIAGYAGNELEKEALNCFFEMQCEGFSPDIVTFAHLLKACGSMGALDEGSNIHCEIVRQGWLEGNGILGGALVDMYVRCDALGKAKKVLEELPTRNVIVWNSLITGFVQAGHGEEALNCFEQMQCENVPADAVTFAVILKACSNIGALDKGKDIHADIVKQGLLGVDTVLGNTLVDMYVRCDALDYSKEVLDGLPIRDLVTWNAFITGYMQGKHYKQALDSFEHMQLEGLSPDAISFICILKACGSTGALATGEAIHSIVVRQGLLEINSELGNALVDMYAKCGAYVKAKEVFEKLCLHDRISWNTLISAYAQLEHGKEALNCFEQMERDGFLPDDVTFICMLKAYGSIGAVDKGAILHSRIVTQRLLEGNVILGNALVDMYAKCGALSKAKEVLEGLAVRDVVSWSALITSYSQREQAKEALYCFQQMQLEGIFPNSVSSACVLKACGDMSAFDRDVNMHLNIVQEGFLKADIVLGSALVDMYARCSAFKEATRVLDWLYGRDTVIWNALIAGYGQRGHGRKALSCFEQMQHEGFSPDIITFICILKACGSVKALDKGEYIHSEIIRLGLLGVDVIVGGGLVDMYVKCGAISKAKEVFEGLPARDVVVWNVLITGYVHAGYGREALICFERMHEECTHPDVVTFACSLKACGIVGALDKGRTIHAEVARWLLLGGDAVLGGAVVDMYAKCGALSKAKEVLEGLLIRNIVAWNAIIAGYAEVQHSMEALNCFERMQLEGLNPDDITFLCVLTASSHSGLFNEGQQYFSRMILDYCIIPRSEHYNCMVNLFGHVGYLDQAIAVIKRIPSFVHSPLFLALLSACQKSGNVKLARWAFQHAVAFDANAAAYYIY